MSERSVLVDRACMDVCVCACVNLFMSVHMKVCVLGRVKFDK